MNDDIAQLLKMLQAQHAALYNRMGTVTDPRVGQTIMLEAQEVLSRINIAQNLVMRQTAASITNAVKDVVSADSQLTGDLKTMADATSIVNLVTKYLGYVDKAIDIAKIVATVV